MKPSESKGSSKRSGRAARSGRMPPTAGEAAWPSTRNWDRTRPLPEDRRQDIRDLLGDFSEQTGAFFG